MANLPLSEDQIMQLQATGKITPITAEKMRSQAAPIAEMPALQESTSNAFPVEQTESKPWLTANADAAQSLSGVPLIGDIAKKEAAFYEKQTQPREVASAPVQAAQASEKVDLSQLAVGPKPAAVEKAPDYMKSSGLNSAYGMQAQGVKDLATAGAQGYDAQAGVINSAAEDAKKYDSEVKSVTEARQVEFKNRMANMDKLQKEKEAVAQINPNRYWQNQSTGSKIAASIAIMFGAIGGAMTGQGGNGAMDIINKAIERDVEAQKDAYEKAKGKISDEQNMFSLSMQEFGDQKSALLASKASALEVAKLQIQGTMAKTQSAEAKARGELMLGQLSEEQKKLGLALGMQSNKNSANRQATMGAGVEDPSLLSEDQQKRIVKMPNGLYKPAVSEQAAKDVNKMVVDSGNMKGIISKIKQLNSPSLPYSERSGLLNSLSKEYALNKKNIENLGAISTTDMDLVMGTLGNPGGLQTEKTNKILDQALEVLKMKEDNAYSQLVPGYKPLHVGGARK